MTETHRRRPAPTVSRRPFALPLIAVLGAVALAPLAVDRASTAAQTDPLTAAQWRQLPSDAPLGGHAAVLRGGVMAVIGGERGDFEAPGAVRALDLGTSPPRWVTLAEDGAAPQPQLAGRGLVGARTAAIDGATTAAVTVCDCAVDTAHGLDWAGGPDAPLSWWPLAAGAPLPHANGLLAYDAPRRRLVAAGGDYRGSGELVTTTWTLDVAALADATWQPGPPLPFQLIFQAADRDPRSGHLVAFGGQGVDAVSTAQLWRADLAGLGAPGAWQDLSAAAGAGPAARSGATLTFVGDSGVAVLFGGYTPEAGERADAWALDYRDPSAPRWRSLDLPGAPSPRSGHSAVWDAAGQRLILYGGLRLDGAGTVYLADAFALALAGDAPTPPTSPTTSPTTPPRPTDAPSATPAAGGRIFLPTALKGAHVRAAP